MKPIDQQLTPGELCGDGGHSWQIISAYSRSFTPSDGEAYLKIGAKCGM